MKFKNMKLVVAIMSMAGMISVAQAQSSVQVYGKMRLIEEVDKVGTAEKQTKLSNANSRLGFRGVEDLGGGLKAFFVIETAISPDAPNTADATKIGDRTSLVGLRTDVWSISGGRQKHAHALLQDNFDAMDAYLGSSVFSVHKGPDARLPNAIHGTFTPVKGLTFNYQQSNQDESTVTTNKKSVKGGGVDYKIGNLSTAYAFYDDGINNKNQIVGARYDIPATKTSFFAMYSEDEVAASPTDIAVKTNGKSVGVRQHVSAPLMLIASYGEHQDLKAYNLGAQYSLSKRTSLIARYRDESATLASKDRKTYGVGIEHNF
jgi:predicted porin